jgi:tRNA threonylcarbamoyladenosine biosynthesis protein TsaB
MPLLAIETSSRALGVAVIGDGRLLSSYELLADYPHAVELPGAVSRVLKDAGTSLDALEAVAVDIGPGSFTGLRIGLAFAKALAVTRKTPLVGVASLDVLAAGLPAAPGSVCCLLDARQKNVYAAAYRLEGGTPVRMSDYRLGPVDDLLPQLGQPAILLGDGVALYRERLLARWPDAQVAPPELWLPRAPTLGRLAAARVARGELDDPARLVPLYLYPLDCSVRGPDRPTAVLR